MKLNPILVSIGVTLLANGLLNNEALSKTATALDSQHLLADSGAVEKDKGPSFSGNASWYGAVSYTHLTLPTIYSV